jgi:hypothetical protein
MDRSRAQLLVEGTNKGQVKVTVEFRVKLP